jgi:hypothetical protein
MCGMKCGNVRVEMAKAAKENKNISSEVSRKDRKARQVKVGQNKAGPDLI